MTLPNFLDPSVCDFRHTLLVNVPDVNTILATLTAQLVTAPAPAFKWTENPAGTFQSPSNSEGHYIRCAFTRAAANTLNMTLTDHHGITICSRAIQINVGVTDVDVYSGAYYVVIESHIAGPSIMLAYMAENVLDRIVQNPYPALGTGYMAAGGGPDGSGSYGWFFMVDTMVAAPVQRVVSVTYSMATVNYRLISPSGYYLFERAYVSQAFRGTVLISGGLWQSLMGPNEVAAWTSLAVPVGDGTTGTFKSTAWGGGAGQGRLFIRTA